MMRQVSMVEILELSSKNKNKKSKMHLKKAQGPK